MDFVTDTDFFGSLKAEDHVFFLVRHGERNHITPQDKDYGAYVGLTQQGKRQALHLGKIIGESIRQNFKEKPNENLIRFYSSPVGRCVETARHIGIGAGLEDPAVQTLESLGKYFVNNHEAYLGTLKAGFYEAICSWLKDNRKDCSPTDPFFPIAERSEELLRLMQSQGKANINIFATHDAWIVPCLAHFCGMEFSPSRWMNFLTGMAVVVNKTERRIVPVTALDTGWMYF